MVIILILKDNNIYLKYLKPLVYIKSMQIQKMEITLMKIMVNLKQNHIQYLFLK